MSQSLTIREALNKAYAQATPSGKELIASIEFTLERSGILNAYIREFSLGCEIKNEIIEEKSRIISVRRGWGERAIYFQTEFPLSKVDYVERIDKYWEVTGNNPQDLKLAYVGFNKGKRVFEMFAGPDITIQYKY